MKKLAFIPALGIALAAASVLPVLTGCAGTPPVGNLVSLEEALAGAVTLVEERTQSGGKIALAKIASPLTALSDFLGGELDKGFTATGKLTVLARGQTLEQVNAEQKLQMSGMVSDESAVSIGHYLGADVVITGDFARFANFSQLSIRAVDVETAQVLAAYAAKLDNRDPVLAGITAPLGSAKGRAVSEAVLEQINLGKDYYAAGLPDIAIEEFDRVLRGNRNVAEAWFYRGNVYAGKGDNDRAIADYTAALRINPNYADALKNRGVAYAAKKDYDRSIADYTAALRIDPNDTEALVNRGHAYNQRALVYFDKEDDDRAIAECGRAIADFTAALQIDPSDVSALLNRGLAYINRAFAYFDDDRAIAECDRAIADFTAALRINPNNVIIHHKRAITYHLFKKEYDKAIADYTAMLEIDPNGEWVFTALYDRAESYIEKGDYDRAIADYEAILRNHHGSYASLALTSRAKLYVKKGDIDKAIEDYTEAIRIDPNNIWTYIKRGDAYYDQGDYFLAEYDYEEALRIDPNSTAAKDALKRARKETELPPLPDLPPLR